MAMTRPDRELIAQVMLFSQGFRTAESLASKIVPFFNLCDEQLSPQPHYDFGLRALKAVLASAGILKRERLQNVRAEGSDGTGAGLSDVISEQIILIQSVTETIVPKLVADDVPLLTRFVPLSDTNLSLHDTNLLVYSLTCFREWTISLLTWMPFVKK
jgi:dynein heavy chain 1